MAGIVYACVAPHGFEIIPEVAGKDRQRFDPTRAGMIELGKEMSACSPDTIVLATPHGFRVEGAVAIATTSFAAGRLGKYGVHVDMELKHDRELALQLLQAAKAEQIPVRGVAFGTASGDASVLPLDWGSFIPLWFLAGKGNSQPNVVIITTTRDHGLKPLVELGRVIAKVALQSGKRIAFVASADQGHAHSADGPYGFDAAAMAYDEQMCDIVRNNHLEQLLHLDSEFVAAAKPDSLWQMAVLLGVHETVPLRGRLVSYQVPTYYGMLCASYRVN